MAAIGFVDDCVVAGGNELAIQRIGAFQQRVPLDMGIAEHAGIWRAASHIFIYEIVNNIIAKFFANVNYEVVKPHIHGYLAGIVDGIQSCNTRFPFWKIRSWRNPRFSS
jgi:hypothetical protein